MSAPSSLPCQKNSVPAGLEAYRKITGQLEHYRPIGTLQASWNITGLQKHFMLLEQRSAFPHSSKRLLYINLTELQGCALQPHFGNYPRQKQAKE